ncbi:MAG: tetratricopeptide repeat protein, partial [Spirochaetes bacterium]|nr:tetratricopeptide repeat protein [Spirochaetota bacterium]
MKKLIIFTVIILLSAEVIYSLHTPLPMAQYNLALGLYMKGHYHSAVKEFRNLINEHPESEKYLSRGRYWLGLSYLAIKKYKLARDNFSYVINHFPRSLYYIDSIYQLGRTYYQWNKRNTAIKYFKKVHKRYPGHELADNSLLWEGVSYYKLNNKDSALSRFYTILKKYPKGN